MLYIADVDTSYIVYITGKGKKKKKKRKTKETDVPSPVANINFFFIFYFFSSGGGLYREKPRGKGTRTYSSVGNVVFGTTKSRLWFEKCCLLERFF